MTFNEWLDEMEGFGMRKERLYATFAHYDKHDWVVLVNWLKYAYEAGYQEGKQDKEGSQ